MACSVVDAVLVIIDVGVVNAVIFGVVVGVVVDVGCADCVVVGVIMIVVANVVCCLTLLLLLPSFIVFAIL